MSNDTINLNTAKRRKLDEFYTQYEDIEKELSYYGVSQFTGKNVFCNCDDPFVSQFYKYFVLNFHRLHLKKLTCACYKEQTNNLFAPLKERKRAYYVVCDGEADANIALNPINLGLYYFRGDGSFSSLESRKLLDDSDIVVTNPPFSLFRKFLALMIKSRKQFLILGNINALTYQDCFEYFMQGKLWLGQSIHSGDREFSVPDGYPLDLTPVKELVDGAILTKSGRIDIQGKKFIRVNGVRWFTNIRPVKDESKDSRYLLSKPYVTSDYPVYDNFKEAINVNSSKEIPSNYTGIMGVPITFLDHWNPNQFELVGNEKTLGIKGARCYIKGKKCFSRIFIRRKESLI